MKNGKKPTVREYKHIKSYGLIPTNWLVSKKTSEFLLLINITSGKTREIPAR